MRFELTLNRYRFSTSDNITLDFHYQSANIVKYRTDVTFGFLDLLVSFGGIAGLFLGCSILSGVEILYYLFVIAMTMAKRLSKKAQNILNKHSSEIKVAGANYNHKKFSHKANNIKVIKIQSLSDNDNIKAKLQNTNQTRY